MAKQRKYLHLAAPRGFCAGVDRAVRIVEVALEKFGAPVYVRHEIVHNRTVVDRLADIGAVFVAEAIFAKRPHSAGFGSAASCSLVQAARHRRNQQERRN